MKLIGKIMCKLLGSHEWRRPRLLEAKICKRCGIMMQIKRRAVK